MQKKIAINIIMGFLGVGKTTAILNLLAKKPDNERWAVLVNEFGEVGIDGAIISAESGMLVSEVPGGCLCCIAGLPFQAALSQIIAQQKPDRVLIEPTGLGHPKNVMRNLTSPEYAQYCELKASICLVDPRQLKDPRYLQHETFNDQCYLADVLVANKVDVCDAEDKRIFERYAEEIIPKKAVLGWVESAQLPVEWLDIARDEHRAVKGVLEYFHSHSHSDHKSHRHSHSEEPLQPVFLPEGEPYQFFQNEGMGYYSLGWLFAGNQIFDYEALSQWLMTLEVERVKGLLITSRGTFVMNLRDQVFTEMPTRALDQSRIEIIHNDVLDKDILQSALLNCISNQNS